MCLAGESLLALCCVPCSTCPFCSLQQSRLCTYTLLAFAMPCRARCCNGGRSLLPQLDNHIFVDTHTLPFLHRRLAIVVHANSTAIIFGVSYGQLRVIWMKSFQKHGLTDWHCCRHGGYSHGGRKRGGSTQGTRSVVGALFNDY
ncbi:unnamed protein product [Mycena citricolor]|uniref:Secreted protein n=1 Tax=Mycena citricolor TaxID=2018698 RepID=A0AAD2K1E7_9AGAR|nr:unnamed protein product [Mycena citricolor]